MRIKLYEKLANKHASPPSPAIDSGLFERSLKSIINEKVSKKKNPMPEQHIQSYEQLLSGFSEAAISSDKPKMKTSHATLAQKIGGQVYQNLSLDSEALKEIISVPYHVREIFSKEASAHAVIFLSFKGQLLIKSLSGQPILRASLFESLQNPSGKQILLSMLTALNTRSLAISLKLIPRIAVNSKGLAHEYRTNLDSKRISFEIYFDKTAKRSNRLPDPFVEKDKAWDREKLKTLRRSLAYKRVLRNHVLAN